MKSIRVNYLTIDKYNELTEAGYTVYFGNSERPVPTPYPRPHKPIKTVKPQRKTAVAKFIEYHACRVNHAKEE